MPLPVMLTQSTKLRMTQAKRESYNQIYFPIQLDPGLKLKEK